MAVQDQSGGTLSGSTLPGRNNISLDVVTPQLKEVATPADEYAPKSRKPYTITKQRERWTDEEHRKFLEALKLYGRAWRPIEEHVGTKTAVQIRSHAQKFFSKVVRESSNGDASSEEPIAIPPPRPKRKPMHPYPRNLATPVESGIPHLEKRRRWRAASPNLSVSEQENQSPTSVLSALGSDAFGTVDSAMPSGSSSPVSSAVARSSGGVVPSETANIIPEDSPAQANASSNPEHQACVKLELLPEDNTTFKEVSDEASSSQCLKLFGQTVLVTDSHRSPSPTSGNLSSIDMNDEPASRPLHWSLVRVKSLASDAECSSSTLTIGTPKQIRYVPTQNGSPRPKESVSSLSPWGSSFVSAASPCIEVHNPIPMKGRPFFNDSNLEDKETEKEVSSSGSNIESATAEICVEKNLDIEAQSSLHALEKAGRELSSIRPSETPNLERRANFTKRVKGFMPYKRCFAKGFVPYKRCLAERGISSLTLTSEEREEQRTRLCL